VALPALPLIDDFQRPDENPLSDGGNWAQWSAPLAPMQLVSHVAVPNNGTQTNISQWQTLFAADQVCAGIMAQVSAAGGFGGSFYLLACSDTIGSVAYQITLAVNSPAHTFQSLFLFRLSDHPWSFLCSMANMPASWQAGDGLAINVNGRTIEAWYQRTGAWTLIDTADDATLSGGAAALGAGRAAIGINTGNANSPPAGWSSIYAGPGGQLFRLPLLGAG